MKDKREVFLVSCVSRKADHPCPARDLYVSPWFAKARAYVESRGADWFILSAAHGLVAPTRRLAPYDVSLHGMRAAQRRRWAESVLQQLQPQLIGVEPVVLLAGRLYREHLEPGIEELGIHTSAPLARLSIGRQLAWFNAWLGVHG